MLAKNLRKLIFRLLYNTIIGDTIRNLNRGYHQEPAKVTGL